MKRTRFKWTLFNLVSLFSGITYSLECSPSTLPLEFSSFYFLRHQESVFPDVTFQSLKTDIPESNMTDACCAYLDHFANSASNFIKCSIERSRPFRFCEECVIPYARAKSIYDDIEKNVGGCHVVLLDADRVQSILQIYTMIKTLWDKSYCDNCFVQESIKEDENGTVTYEFNTDTIDFLDQYKNLTLCIKPYTNDTYPDINRETVVNKTVCSACLQDYSTLNSHFKDIRKTTGGKICMDLVDMMNYTRLMWGGETDLNCTQHDRDDMPVLLTSFIILTTPLLFYGASCICGERRKLKLLTQKRLKNPISVEVSHLNHSSEGNHVYSHTNSVS